MSKIRRAKHSLAPWAGLIAGGLGWALSHQTGSDSVTSNCIGTHWWLLLAIGIAGLAMSAAGGALSLAVMRGSNEVDTGPRRFIAAVCALAALLLGLAIVIQTLAGLIIPRCFA